MNEKLDELEAELAAMRPRALPSAVLDRVATGLATAPSERSSRWSDRFLLSAIGVGAIAACVIVTTMLKPAAAVRPGAPAPNVAVITADPSPPRAGDYALATARADYHP